MFNYSNHLDVNPISTSPLYIELDLSTDINTKDENHITYLISSPKMLGEPVTFTATMLDYFNRIVDPTIFLMSCDNCGSDYVLSKSQIVVSSNSLQEFQISSNLIQDVSSRGRYVNITFTSPSYHMPTETTLAVRLSPCQRGHKYNSSKCVCYPHPDIVQCNSNYSEIRIGYWVGIVSIKTFTSSLCPINYTVNNV